jgi:hypothetical protein
VDRCSTAEAKATEELFVRNFADFDYVVAPSGSLVAVGMIFRTAA